MPYPDILARANIAGFSSVEVASHLDAMHGGYLQAQ
jgi:hypothetical protein